MKILYPAAEQCANGYVTNGDCLPAQPEVTVGEPQIHEPVKLIAAVMFMAARDGHLEIVETLIEEAMRIAETMEPVEGGSAEVSIS